MNVPFSYYVSLMLHWLSPKFNKTSDNLEEQSGWGICLVNLHVGELTSARRPGSLNQSCHFNQSLYRYGIDVSILDVAYGFSEGYILREGKLLCQQHWHFLRQNFSINIVYLISFVKFALLSPSLSHFDKTELRNLCGSPLSSKTQDEYTPTLRRHKPRFIF